MPDFPRDDIINRMGRIESRFDWLDEHGTRQVNVLAIQVTNLAREFAQLETAVQTAVARLEERRKVRWTSIVGFIAALTPLYALVISIIQAKGVL